jgi:hypothetical protein
VRMSFHRSMATRQCGAERPQRWIWICIAL